MYIEQKYLKLEFSYIFLLYLSIIIYNFGKYSNILFYAHIFSELKKVSQGSHGILNLIIIREKQVYDVHTKQTI